MPNNRLCENPFMVSYGVAQDRLAHHERKRKHGNQLLIRSP
jgi:hypothetical protein